MTSPVDPGAVRAPVVAGAFYPAEHGRLAADVDGRLARASPARSRRAARAIVVPHAGYVYSGDVAALAYALVRQQSPARVAIAGPAHFVALRGAAVPRAVAWRTPLGEVEIDAGLRDVALDAGAAADDRPHAREHSIEVQVPFLQRIRPAPFSILPVAVGEMAAAAAADLFAELATVADLLVISTDLSHYLDESTARRHDERTIRAVLRGDPRGIEEDAACGLYALRGVTEWVRRSGLPVRLLDHRTSADAGGDRDRVVGYAAFAIS